MIPYRDENPTYSFPYINYIIIFLNVIIFFLQVLDGFSGGMFNKYSMIPRYFWDAPFKEFYRIFTSMFMHAGWLHIIGNMLFLWIFGDNIEDVLGHFRYLVFYLSAGIVGALAQSILTPSSLIPMVGASGAISGVIAVYLIFFPKVKVRFLLLFIFKVKLPAFAFIFVWILTQILSGLRSLSYIKEVGGGVAYFAHIGGIATGLFYAAVKRRKLMNKWKARVKKIRRAKVKKNI